MALKVRFGTTPSLQVRVKAQFPASIDGGTAIVSARLGNTFTIDWDITELSIDTSILTTEIAHIYTAVYDSVLATYSRVTLDTIRTAIVSGGGAGDVVGPSTATDNAVVRYDGATGKIIQNSAVLIDDTNNVSGVGTLASGAHTITSSSANALAVGLLGATTPALLVDASTASSITGVKIKSAATAGGVAVSAVGETNVQLNIDAAGSGALVLQGTGTGATQFGTNAVPKTSDGAALGTTALMWSDAFLASGAVVNFNNGDVTVTHAADTLTFAGAASGYKFGNLVVPSADDGAPLGSTSLNWSDLFLATGAVINYANGNAAITHSSGVLTVSTGDLRVTTAGTNTASVVTIDGTQTLANKTLTAPVLGGSTAHGIVIAEGASAVVSTAAMTDGQLLVGQSAADPLPKTMSSDATLSAAGALTIASNAVTYAKMQDVTATSRILGRKTAGSGDPEECTLSEALDFIGSAAQGDILFRGAATWSRLGAGTTGQFLKTTGAGGNPLWASLSGGGDMLGANNLTDVANAATALGNLGGAALASPTFTGTPAAPTAAAGTSTTQLATTAFVATQGVLGLLTGLTLSNDAGDLTNDIGIATGTAANSTGVINMTLGSALIKQLDAVWAVGTNAGMRASGAAIANTTYFIFLIRRTDTGVVDVAADTSATGANVTANTNANYTQMRRIGAIVRTGAAIKAFSQLGDDFLWLVPPADIAVSTATNTSGVSATLTVPIGIQVDAKLIVRADFNTSGNFLLITSLDQTNTAPSSALATNPVNANAATQAIFMIVRTNTSGQVRQRSDSTNVLYGLQTHGWIDRRGRDGGA